MKHSIGIVGDDPAYAEILTREALEFVLRLQQEFNPRREELLAQRKERQAAISAGQMPDFLPETAHIRGGDWQVAPTPADLLLRRVEITGPTERKMMINALNSGANVFMADCEDALSPTWDNIVRGQINLRDAVRRSIEFANPDGRTYSLNDKTATLLVRPRGWHLVEKHALVDYDKPVSASLFDFGLYFFHNARELLNRGSGPYFYLPKLESHLEARLWNDVFNYAQEALGIPRGTIRATVLIETILAAFEMEEILYELRDHAAGLNAGRWDYIFSAIKKLRDSAALLPDRAQVTMTVPFMRAYTELLVKSCHSHGAHAMGGMAAFIPNRREPEVTVQALTKVREDKQREANDGFDGTWVAHPDLVLVAMAEFDAVLGDKPHQKERTRPEVQVSAAQLLDLMVPGGVITEVGARTNISVALQYIAAWLLGNGAVAINNLMEDAATAEICRAQLWQWRHHNARLDDGSTLDSARYKEMRQQELAKLTASSGPYRAALGNAASILDTLVLRDDFTDFLTLPAYEELE